MKNLTKVMLLAVLLFAGQACSDLLDNPQPTTSISQEVALSDPGAVQAIRANLYDYLHTTDYTTLYMLGPEVLADNLNNRASTNRYSGLAENAPGSGMSSYGTAYNLINDANLIINAVGEGVLPADQLRQYRGEAYMLRAFAMHHLVRALGYEPGMTPNTGEGANWTEGIIIRTTPTLQPSDANFRPRSSVSAVYDQIRSDLQQSIDLLSQGDAETPEYVTEAAAHALLARVELYARNYSEANSQAQLALDASDAELAQPDEVATMFDETTGLNPEAIFITVVNPSTESQGVNNSLNAYTAQQWVAQVPTQDLMDLYGDEDARLAWYAQCVNDVDGSVVSGCLATHPAIQNGEVKLETQKWNGELGSYADNVPLFRVAEMLLIQSEARLNGATGEPDEPLNRLRAARNLNSVPATMENILDERRREFAAEGHRFFDLKRLGMDIRKPPELPRPTYADLPFSDYKVLDDLPESEVALSQQEAPSDSVLVQNPGY